MNEWNCTSQFSLCAHCLIPSHLAEDSAFLCIDAEKVTPELEAHLREGDVNVRPYESVLDLVRDAPGKIWLDSTNVNYALYEAATCAAECDSISSRVCDKMSPIQLAKAIKNDNEIEGELELLIVCCLCMRAAHLFTLCCRHEGGTYA